MKAVSFWQPWATLIAEGYKTVETRTHPRLRGLRRHRVAIHAARVFDRTAWPVIRNTLGARTPHRISELERARSSEFPMCAIVAVAEVLWANWALPDLLDAATHERLALDAMCPVADRFCLRLEFVRRVDPFIPCRGHQGIWCVPGDAFDLLCQQGAALECERHS